MLSPLDIFDLRTFSEPSLSPDGTQILYIEHTADIQSDKRNAHLSLININGSHPRQITEGERSDSSPCFSPDGKRCAFLSTIEGKTDVYLWDGAVHRLTSFEEAPSGLGWSPDGSQLSFTRLVPTHRAPICKMPDKPEGAFWAEPPRCIELQPYFVDGAGFIQPGATQIFVMELESGQCEQITSGEAHFGKTGWSFDPTPRWTSDGAQLITAMMPLASDPGFTCIVSISLDSGDPIQLTPDSVAADSPAISPDGARIAFIGWSRSHAIYEVRKLFVMDLDGSNMRCLSLPLDRSIYSPSWSADSETICFIYDDQGITKLGSVTLDGSFRCLGKDLGGNGLAYGVPYGGASYSLAPQGGFVFNATRPDLPSELRSGHLDASGCQTLLRPAQSCAFNDAEEIWFTSPIDQVQLQGWIIKPPHFDPNEQWPLILHVHGGPMANFGERFDIEHQLWASAGYVVFYVNYRGSTSYGEQFAQLIDKSFPLGVEHDLNAAVDAVLELGYVDASALFITGPSAGGCLTCWMVGLTDRFRAAAASYPVTNWHSQLLASDIAHVIPKLFLQMPWEDAEDYLQRSPITNVGRVTTPTLLLCGEVDRRTPMGQAEQFYQALKIRGIDSALVRFPDEPHGVRVRPSHQLAKALYVRGWFDRYLPATSKPLAATNHARSS